MLGEAARSEPGELAWAAVWALGQIGDEAAVEPCSTRCSAGVRTASSRDALGEIGDRAAVERLCEMLDYEDDESARFAVEALGKIGDARAIRPLCSFLERGPDGVHAWCAREALGKITDPEAVQPFCEALRSPFRRSAPISGKIAGWLAAPRVLPELEALRATSIPTCGERRAGPSQALEDPCALFASCSRTRTRTCERRRWPC